MCGGEDSDPDIEGIILYFIHGYRIESWVLECSILSIRYNILGESGVWNDCSYASSELVIHLDGHETRSFLPELLVVELYFFWIA